MDIKSKIRQKLNEEKSFSPMTYEQAKLKRDELEAALNKASEELKAFDKFKGPTGLTPDHIRALPEWKKAKEKSQMAFTNLQKFNQYFTKTFKKEYKADREARLSKFLKP